MNVEYLARMIASEVKTGKTAEQARDEALQAGFPADLVEQAVALYQEKVRAVSISKRPAAFRDRDRKDWYPGPQDSDTFWPRLKMYLLDEKNWDPKVVEKVDEASTKVVSLLDAPGEDGFQTRGLVLGYVQSGKTANFTAVIAKAADAGYKLFIVLSGLHNSLRSQTQDRLEAELVALNPERWHPLTSVDHDFTSHHRNAGAFLTEDGPQKSLCIVKKNDKVLLKLVSWLRTAGSAVLRSCPVLVIDDEADQASINTGTAEVRSRINQLIVDILRVFPRCAYVGYTATPFANVLSDPTWPPGLYPRHFIVDLPRPEAYYGTERIFGAVPPDQDEAFEDGLDVVRIVPDTDLEHLKPRSRATRGSFEPQLTDSLREALHWFWLSAAIRFARGQAEQHISMLIHSTLYTDVHDRFKPLVEDERDRVIGLVEEGHEGHLEELHALWERETTAVSAEAMGEEPVPWEHVREHLLKVLSATKVPVDNANSTERLKFPKDTGSVQIVIGGNTLSRGLTIEGLTVSYFLRASTTYDTLLQMGRWFGYRFGYSDLPRIWMTAELREAFQHLARVEAEIRDDIARYEREDITPRDFGVRIQTHSTLAVTSPMKMQHAIICKMTFNAAVKQTTFFRHLDGDWLKENIEAARALLAAAHRVRGPEEIWKQKHLLYRKVNVGFIHDFLRRYHVHEKHEDMQTEMMLGYIADQNTDGRLLDWNVCVVGQGARAPGTWGGLMPDGREIPLLTRSRMAGDSDADLKAIMSQVDRAVDFGLDASPKLTRFKEWAEKQGVLARDQELNYIEWAVDYRSPLDDRDDVDPSRGLRTPLLLLYPIHKNREPSYPDRPSKGKSPPRRPLGAAEHVVGLAVIFPQARKLTPQDYVTVDLAHVDREEPAPTDEDGEA